MSLINDFRKISSTRRDLRNFGLVVGGVFAAIGAYLFWKKGMHQPPLLYIGAIMIALGLLAPALLKPFQLAWMALAVIMGHFMTRLILGVSFFIMITPMALVARAMGKRFLELRFREPEAPTYWESRGEAQHGGYDKQY